VQFADRCAPWNIVVGSSCFGFLDIASGRTTQNFASNSCYIIACVPVVAIASWLSKLCLSTSVFAEPSVCGCLFWFPSSSFQHTCHNNISGFDTNRCSDAFVPILKHIVNLKYLSSFLLLRGRKRKLFKF
jgi:hypothetical protein